MKVRTKRWLTAVVATLTLGLLAFLLAPSGGRVRSPPPPSPPEPEPPFDTIIELPEAKAHPVENPLSPPLLALPKTPDEEAPGEEPTRVRVLNIGTGLPVPGVGIVGLSSDGQESSHSTNSGGEFLVDGQMPSTFRAEDWTIVSKEADPEGQCVVLWAYQLMQLDIQIVGRSPVKILELDKVKLLLLAVERKGRSSACSPVLDSSWINAHRMDRIVLPRPDADGWVTVRVPMLPGYRVCASAPGWRSATENMPCRTQTGQHLRLVLEKESFLVKGALTDPDGKPFANVGVAAYIVVEMPYDQVDKAAIRAVGHGYTYCGSASRNKAVVAYMTVATTDSAGRFEIEAKVAGQLILVARPRGNWQHVRKEMGSFSSDVENVELVAQRHRGTVTIVRNGRPLAGQRICVSDIEDWRFNPTFGATLDERGGMTSGGFIQGHEYSLFLRSAPTRSYYIVWSGQKKIDLSTLPNERASFRAHDRK